MKNLNSKAVENFIGLRDLFPRIIRLLRKLAENNSSKTGLNNNQAFTVLYLMKAGIAKMGDIQKHSILTKGAITSMITLMEEDGILLRYHSIEDRRSVLVSLTPKGKKIGETLRNENLKNFNLLFDMLSDEDRTNFESAIKGLNTTIGKMEELHEKSDK